MAAPVVEVVGLNALARDLARAADPRAGELLTAMKDAGRRAATPVAERTRGTVPHEKGSLAGSVRISATRSGAAVRVGSKSVPYAGPVDFGGWPQGRPYLPDGRYLFPAAQGLAAQAVREYNEAIERGLDHFSWTNATDTAGAVHD